MTAAPVPARGRRIRAIGHLARLGAAVVVTGIATGLAVMLLVTIVHSVEHLVWGMQPGPFLDGLAYPANDWLPLLSVTAAGIIAAGGWYLLRRFGRPIASVEHGVAGKLMPAVETLVDTVLQVTAVALGASIGKEVAPRELSAMTASKLAGWFRLTPRWRRILIASAAGAGLAAVYNVPLAGALFATEILLGEFSLGAAVASLAISAIATQTARPLVPDESLYHLASVSVNGSLIVAALLIGPLMGAAGSSFIGLTGWLGTHRPTGWRLLVALPVVFAGVGALGMVFPLVLGNGRGLATAGFDLSQAWWLLLLLALAKYAATVLSLGAGAVGGTLQPSIAIGAALGGAAAIGWEHLWPGASATALAITAAGAFLAASMRAPFTAMALVCEFTGTGFTLLVPVLLAVAGSLAASALLQPRSLHAFATDHPALGAQRAGEPG